MDKYCNIFRYLAVKNLKETVTRTRRLKDDNEKRNQSYKARCNHSDGKIKKRRRHKRIILTTSALILRIIDSSFYDTLRLRKDTSTPSSTEEIKTEGKTAGKQTPRKKSTSYNRHILLLLVGHIKIRPKPIPNESKC
ncbi:hypothetical protein CHS0354_041318, partial [Potamilus streckersoni]